MSTMMQRLLWIAQQQHLITPVMVMITLVMLLIPLPTIFLDLAIAMNFTICLAILMVVMYLPKPTAFSSFPSVLLVTTLFRLSLNVASTRQILLNGHQGADAAGGVIKAFGKIVAGDNIIIGMVMFGILIIIQMVVINAGSSRIAEVTARFTLDAMPGKQMSIDADLNAGLINEQEALARRKELQEEADFFGAMDGAIKFVAKDALAGLLITGINIVGGILFGVIKYDMKIIEATEVFTVLTIGDGLVSALPSLFVSIAAGLLTTRATAKKSLGEDIVSQMFFDKKPLYFVGGALIFFGLTVLPFPPFAIAGSTFLAIAYYRHREENQGLANSPGGGPSGRITDGGGGGGDKALPAGSQAASPAQPESIEKLLKVDMMGLEVGYGLIALVDTKRGGNILERIKSVRRQLAMEMGMVVPPIRIRDNLQLRPNQYSILLKSVSVATGELMLNHLLAMNPGTAVGSIDGILTREPAFGLEAYWIKEAQKDQAHSMGYTVVDLQTVVTTHLSEIIKRHAHELLGRQETQALLDNLAETYPKIVEDLVPGMLNVGIIQRVLQNLLSERVSIRDLLSILEALAEHAALTKDPSLLTELVRQTISRVLVLPYLSDRRELAVIVLNPNLERYMTESIQQTESGNYLVLPPDKAQRFVDRLTNAIENSAFAIQPILLVNPGLRLPLRRLLEKVLSNLVILGQGEIPAGVNVITIGVVGDL